MLEKPRCAGQAAVKRAAGVMRVKVLLLKSSPNAREPMAADVWICLVGERTREACREAGEAAIGR